MGIHVARVAREAIGPALDDPDAVAAIIERNCRPTDAIQALTACTFGAGNLITRDWGKSAYTFVRKADGYAVRIVRRPATATAAALTTSQPASDGTAAPGGPGTAPEGAAAKEHRGWQILEQPARDFLAVQDVDVPVPAKATRPPTPLVSCPDCREDVVEAEAVSLGGEVVCVPCRQARLATLGG